MKNANQYSSDWIAQLEKETHWRYYWQQQKLMSNYLSTNDKLLEIGVGSKFTSNYLKSKNFDIKTIDIDADKKPDIVANITDYKSSEMYDHVLAFEIFEHLPFEDFEKAIENISDYCKKSIFMSIPRNEKLRLRLSLDLKFFKIEDFQIATKRNKILTKHHHWELDYKNYTQQRVIDVFSKNGFHLTMRHKFHSLRYFVFQKTEHAE